MKNYKNAYFNVRKVKHVKFIAMTDLVSLEQEINFFVDTNPGYKILGIRLNIQELSRQTVIYIATITYLADLVDDVYTKIKEEDNLDATNLDLELFDKDELEDEEED